MTLRLLTLALAALAAAPLHAGVGDPQLRTDHPWYPGELACSTFARLFETQADVYERVVGRRPASDEDKALASWLWRNTHYWHGTEGAEDLWGQGFGQGGDCRTRDYWTGLFAHGYGLCGTTHSQWGAEMEALLGHGRGRGVGVAGHNSFEVLLEGGEYGKGQWAALDHDLSTVVFSPDGKKLLSLAAIQKDWKRLVDRKFAPERQRGWLVCGLHPSDAGSYARYTTAEYLPGYAGPPPTVHLRRGEKLRRYLEPGLADGKTLVFWGRNDAEAAVTGPSRAETWVNQPDAMRGSKTGAGGTAGRARFANAVFTYAPDFRTGDYKEGVVEESPDAVTFEFASPYIVGATPPNAKPFGVYDAGGRNGLVLKSKVNCAVSVSVDRGATWQAGGELADGLDLTDLVKGRRQYFLKLHAGAKALADSGLTVTTVCQASAATMPRLKDGGTVVEFEAGGRAVVSAGPNLPQANAHVVAGAFGTPAVTLELKTPRREPALAVYAAAHVLSRSPPRPQVKYQIDASLDGGKTWKPVVKDWSIPRRGEEPPDFWSQSLCWGSLDLTGAPTSVQVRFRNDGGHAYARGEAHLAYAVKPLDPTAALISYTDDTGPHTAGHVYGPGPARASWDIPTGKNVRTHWVELSPAYPR